MARRRNLHKYSGIFSECIAEKRKRDEEQRAQAEAAQKPAEDEKETPNGK